MSQTFNLMDTNPNVLSNGCLCSEIGTQDTAGPFIVFNATETDSGISPFPVICAACVCKAAELVARATTDPQRAQVAADDNEVILPKPTRKRPRADEDGPTI